MPIGISGSSVEPRCRGKSGRGRLSSVGESEFEENRSEGKPYTSASYAEGLVVCGNLNVAPRRAGDCQLVLGRDLSAS